MCKMIISQWKMEKAIVPILASVILFATLIEGVLNVNVYKLDGDIGIGGMVPMVVSLAVLIIIALGSFIQGYNQAVALGRARKNYVTAYYINLVLCAMGCVVVSLLLGMANSAICSNVVKTDIWDKSFANAFIDNMPLVIVGLLLYAAMVMCISGLYLRFGRVAFWIMWGLYMIAIFAGPGLLDRFNIKFSITKEMAQNLQGLLGIVIGLVATLVLLVITWATTHKTKVKNY